MDSLTSRNREWLDQRFSIDEGTYLAHQPIYGFGHGTTEGTHIRRICRTLNMFRSAIPLRPASILDVGGAEGYSMSLARHVLGCDVITSDLSINACQRAREFWGLRGAALDAADLPFADNTFDMVWCSEVIEHLAHPFQTLAELLRVARRYVLITTEEAFPWSIHREAFLKTRHPDEPHFDRNVWMPRDFEVLFGKRCVLRPQFALPARTASETDPCRARRLVIKMTAPSAIRFSTQGVLLLIDKQDHPIPPPVTDRDAEILDLLFRGPVGACLTRTDSWSATMVRTIQCPDCRSLLELVTNRQIVCQKCHRSFGSSDGVLELFASRRKERDRTDEAMAVRRIVPDEKRQQYLLHLADRFESPNVAKTRVSYTLWRVVRGLLNRVRWALAALEPRLEGAK
jgi:hypothetical protein